MALHLVQLIYYNKENHEKRGERKMAIPIKETPILRGKDATSFIKKANSPIKATSNVRKRVFENYSKLSKIAKYK